MTSPDLEAPSIAVIIPVYNEAARLPALLAQLAAMGAGVTLEIIVVDAGSDDGSLQLAQAGAQQVLSAAPGRADQMNLGARQARQQLLWFLHADSVVPETATAALSEAWRSGAGWGRFDVQFDNPAWRYRLLAGMMNWRSRLTGICTGDQGLFVRRDLFEHLGGYVSMPLMEDIELSRRLRRHGWPCCLRTALTTSSRRWQQQGFVRTVLFMWSLRWRYFAGASPQSLAQRYYPQRAWTAGSGRNSSSDHDS